MNILLVGINFGDYESRIVDNLEKQGHNVFYMYDTDEHYTFYIRLFGRKFANKMTIEYQKKKLKELPNNFDRVIVLVGRQLTLYFLNNVKKNNPHAKFLLYLWDDIRRVENFKTTRHIYDEIYSFDLRDCRDYEFRHLPLFFSERLKETSKQKIDIYSAMYSHSEREKIICSVAKQSVVLNKKYRFYISLGRYEYLKRYAEIKKNKDNNLVYVPTPISEYENYKNMSEARTILDIQFSSQIGLTMRTIESLGMKNKLITTNSSIKYYDFYNENNIFIIDRKNPLLSNDFFDVEYKEVPKNIYEKYSLETWVKTLTGEIELNNYVGDYDIKEMVFN